MSGNTPQPPQKRHLFGWLKQASLWQVLVAPILVGLVIVFAESRMLNEGGGTANPAPGSTLPALPTSAPTARSDIIITDLMWGSKQTDYATVSSSDPVEVKGGKLLYVKVEVAPFEAKEGLTFRWYTCRNGDSPVEQHIGDSTFVYDAPKDKEAKGSDCVRVNVERGEELIASRHMFVEVQ